MELTSGNIAVEVTDGVGILRFERPDALNAITNAMYRDIATSWERFAADDEVRVVIVTGTGRALSVGLDLKEFTSDREGHEEMAKQAQENRRRITGQDFGLAKPVICAVNGIVAGGGLHFVADADVVIAARSASFLDPHVSVGQVSVAETATLAYRMPFGEAMRLMLLGSKGRLSAERAYEVGLVGELVEDEALPARAMEIGRAMAAVDPDEAARVKRVLWATLGHRLLDGVVDETSNSLRDGAGSGAR